MLDAYSLAIGLAVACPPQWLPVVLSFANLPDQPGMDSGLDSPSGTRPGLDSLLDEAPQTSGGDSFQSSAMSWFIAGGLSSTNPIPRPDPNPNPNPNRP